MMVNDRILLVEGRGFDSNMYVITDDAGALTVVDTGHDGERQYLLDAIKKTGKGPADIANVILTHVHVDHSGGLDWLVRLSGAKVHVCAIEADAIEKGDLTLTLAGMFKGRQEKVKVDVRLKEGDVIDLGQHRFTVLVTPGHTRGSICLFDERAKVLISGDTAFADGSFGRVDFPSGSAPELQASLQRLASLDVETLLPGHMQPVLHGAGKHLAMSARYARGTGWF